VTGAGAITSASGFCVENLAEQISTHNPRPLDAKALGKARTAVIQAFGQVLAGMPTAMAKSLLGASGVAINGGASLVFGTERRTSAADAALINATAAAADPETSSSAARAAYVVSLFGLCEERKKTGKEFVDALMFGAEASSSFASRFSGAGIGELHFSLFGAIVGASRALGLSRPKIAAALQLGGFAGNRAVADNQSGLSGLANGLGMKHALFAVALAEAMDDASCAELIGNAATASRAADTPAPNTGDLLAIQSRPGDDPWDRFERQAGAVLPRDHIAPLFERLETIDKVSDLATVSRLLQARKTQMAATKIVFAPRGAHEPEETTWVP
jgi:MmgE/PrpD N-terminal domain